MGRESHDSCKYNLGGLLVIAATVSMSLMIVIK